MSLGEEARHLADLHEPLAAPRALHREPTLGLPAAERLHGHAEHLGRLFARLAFQVAQDDGHAIFVAQPMQLPVEQRRSRRPTCHRCS